MRRQKKEHPLHAALAAAEAAIQSKGEPAARVAAALSILADGLATMLAVSDDVPTRASSPGTKQALLRHRQSQDRRIAEIRSISAEANDAEEGDLEEMSKRARRSTKAALRTQVRKLRLRRRSADDGPGGES